MKYPSRTRVMSAPPVLQWPRRAGTA
jgi:hypothetical protein